MRHTFPLISATLFLATVAFAFDAPPTPSPTPTETGILRFLQTAQSPRDEAIFFEDVQSAIKERRMDWLVAAAKNPDKNMKYYTVATVERLAKPDRCQLWSTLLTDSDWAETTAGLNPEGLLVVQRVADSEAAKLLGDGNPRSVSKSADRQHIRTQLQHARLIEIGRQEIQQGKGAEVDWLGDLEGRNDLSLSDARMIADALTEWAEPARDARQTSRADVLPRMQGLLERALGLPANTKPAAGFESKNAQDWVRGIIRKRLHDPAVTSGQRDEIRKCLVGIE